MSPSFRFATAASILVLAACVGGDSDAAYPSSTSRPARLERSGARLQVRGYESDGIFLAGGSPVEQSAVLDPRIDDECRFEKAADGKIRCLPVHAVRATSGFADAGCTEPLFATADPCRPAGKNARIVEGTACDPHVRIHAISPATEAFELRDGECVTAPPHAGTYVAGAEIPATTFAEATAVTR